MTEATDEGPAIGMHRLLVHSSFTQWLNAQPPGTHPDLYTVPDGYAVQVMPIPPLNVGEWQVVVVRVFKVA